LPQEIAYARPADPDRWVEIQIPLDKVNILDAVTYKNELILGTAKGIYTMTLE